MSSDQFKLSQHAGQAPKVHVDGFREDRATHSSELCGCRVTRIRYPVAGVGGSSAVPVIPILGYSSGYSSEPLSGRAALRSSWANTMDGSTISMPLSSTVRT